jgi:hypothetical protein
MRGIVLSGRTWISPPTRSVISHVVLEPGGKTGAHHHGRQSL